MSSKYRLSTLGCKVNQYESQQVRELLESLGLRRAAEGERADWAIVNTCAVTRSAAAKSRQAIRRLGAAGATQTIAIGCYASADPEAVAALEGVTHVLGHESDILAGIRELVARSLAETPVGAAQGTGPVPPEVVQAGLSLSGVVPGAPPEPGPTPRPDESVVATTTISISPSSSFVNTGDSVIGLIRSFSGHTRAFLKVQDGCDARCTYCIIPQLRTRLRSKPIEVAVAEARQLVASGHREIVLTGVFLGAYGRATARRGRLASAPSPLAALVDALAQVEGLRRLRLSSLEPGDVDDALLEVLARYENCVPHLHLPLQSGSAEVLRRMNRQYTVYDFMGMIHRVKAALDRPAISTDVIVGFCGETDEMFEQTLSVARHAKFCKIHAFPFSPRPGTAAARWRNQFVPSQTVKDRMIELRKLEGELAHAFQAQFVGETTGVLIEGTSPPGDNGEAALKPACLAHGRSDRYFEVFFAAPHVKPGELVTVRIDRVAPKGVHGSLATERSSCRVRPAGHCCWPARRTLRN